jgi:hypothetical protein
MRHIAKRSPNNRTRRPFGNRESGALFPGDSVTCPPQFHFRRDSNGVEVGILIEQGGRTMPVEIKSGRTVTREFFSGLEKWTTLAGEMAIDPTLIYGGEENYRQKGIRVLSWHSCYRICTIKDFSLRSK